MKVELKLTAFFFFTFSPPLTPGLSSSCFNQWRHSQWVIFCASALLFVMDGDILYKIMWTDTLKNYVVKCCPHFSEVNTEAESLCSDESHAVNAVNQMRMERMVFSEIWGLSGLCQVLKSLLLLPFQLLGWSHDLYGTRETSYVEVWWWMCGGSLWSVVSEKKLWICSYCQVTSCLWIASLQETFPGRRYLDYGEASWKTQTSECLKQLETWVIKADVEGSDCLLLLLV